jgi:uncharacterized iron-regulated membrane protein
MPVPINIKRWFWVHRWTSLICTLFLLMLCLTGLPLIFEEELDQWLSKNPPYASLPKDTPMASLDDMVHIARQRYPSHVVSFVFVDDDEPQVRVNMLPNYDAAPNLSHSLQFDARTARLLKDEPPITQQSQTFTGLMLSLHRDLFMDLPGELFLGFMGLLFVFSIISGILLYGPYMKKLKFGAIRKDRSRRLKWLDLHNLLGIVTMVWLLVIGITGVFNELSTPLFGIWQQTDVKKMLQPYQGKRAPAPDEQSSPQTAFETAQKALPGMTVTSVVFPGFKFGSPYHYLLWTKGNTPLTSRLFSPVLVDARSGELSTVVKMPWYLRSLEVARPLHFGDYGGTPLKIIWALFDLAAIFVLISGIYLWFARRKSQEAYFLRTDTLST